MAFLSLSGVTKQFGTFTAVERFDLDAERGEFISFLGPSGCGKTTTLRMIAGFEQPTSGRIALDDRDLTYVPANKRNVGMVFQSYALFPNMSVADNIAFGLKVRGWSRDRIRAKVDELLELIHLGGKGGKYPYELSGGMQQRVALARALAIEPEILLLDEPLSALDAKIRVALRQEIRSIQRQLGITTVYVTHDQEEALSLSDRVVVMSEGRIEQVGTPFEVYNFPTTSFVAKFVGTLNVVRATVVDAAGGVLAAADGQQLRAPGPIEAAATGAAVAVALRPERVRIGDGAGANRLSGTIRDVMFLGSTIRLRMRLADGTPLVFDTFNDPHLTLPTRGDTVTVSFAPEAVLVLDREAAEGIRDVVELEV